MIALAAVLCAALSAFLLPRGTNAAEKRLEGQFQTSRPRQGIAGERALTPRGSGHDGRGRADGEKEGDSQERRRRDALLRRAAAGSAGVLCLVLLGGLLGAVVGVGAAGAAWFWFGRVGGAEDRRRRARLIADLPIAVDLLAACLRGGAPWHGAVTAVADAVGGPLGDELRDVSVQISLGADPVDAWLALTREPMLAPLARTAVRATTTGAALAPSLSRLARDQRRVARTAAATRARAAGIRALAPLGLCFLPAFVLLGVVPAVAGIAATILLPR
ncbi:type II secretion system F family protein [Actinomadura sp. NPDC049382]|uniref:type II secretion system F family protein n=1 Tax=Actinomadura sp. NPDC049382 TaxID=3158220 RepID=UPI003444F761